MFQIQLREYISKKPNGDRDTSGGKDSSAFKVVLINEDGAETVLAQFDGYDNFWSNSRNDRPEAQKYLEEKAEFFDAKVLPHRTFREVPVTNMEWREVEG